MGGRCGNEPVMGCRNFHCDTTLFCAPHEALEDYFLSPCSVTQGTAASCIVLRNSSYSPLTGFFFIGSGWMECVRHSEKHKNKGEVPSRKVCARTQDLSLKKKEENYRLKLLCQHDSSGFGNGQRTTALTCTACPIVVYNLGTLRFTSHQLCEEQSSQTTHGVINVIYKVFTTHCLVPCFAKVLGCRVNHETEITDNHAAHNT